MKEHPIIFSGPMVRAIFEGRKTQTRRVVSKWNSETSIPWERLEFDETKVPKAANVVLFSDGIRQKGVRHQYLHVPTKPHPEDPQEPDYWTVNRVYPRWNPGDKLWGKETFKPFDAGHGCHYRADVGHHTGGPWKPSIFMPRSASRITLEITSVGVEQLQDISEEDAQAEGIAPDPLRPSLWTWPGYPSGSTNPVYAYQLLWDFIHGKEQQWVENPWVWVITFKRV